MPRMLILVGAVFLVPKFKIHLAEKLFLVVGVAAAVTAVAVGVALAGDRKVVVVLVRVMRVPIQYGMAPRDLVMVDGLKVVAAAAGEP